MKTVSKSAIIIFMFILTACHTSKKSKMHKIASISEASGISYCDNTDTLIVAGDEGSIYEINAKGKILSANKLGNYDLEGAVCENDRIILAVENKGLLEVNRKTLKTKFFKLKGSGFKITNKQGIEGIAKIKNRYCLAVQSDKKRDSKLLIVQLDKNSADVQKVIKHKIIDSAGLAYKNKKLYIVSDKKDALYIYDIDSNKIDKKIKLKKFAQEGVAFDKKNNIFFADDNGAVMKYKLKELGLQ